MDIAVFIPLLHTICSLFYLKLVWVHYLLSLRFLVPLVLDVIQFQPMQSIMIWEETRLCYLTLYLMVTSKPLPC